jgi:hypothetical protein
MQTTQQRGIRYGWPLQPQVERPDPRQRGTAQPAYHKGKHALDQRIPRCIKRNSARNATLGSTVSLPRAYMYLLVVPWKLIIAAINEVTKSVCPAVAANDPR